jgi:hypothetical protein
MRLDGDIGGVGEHREESTADTIENASIEMKIGVINHCQPILATCRFAVVDSLSGGDRCTFNADRFPETHGTNRCKFAAAAPEGRDVACN